MIFHQEEILKFVHKICKFSFLAKKFYTEEIDDGAFGKSGKKRRQNIIK